MSRTALPTTTPPGSATNAGAALTFTAADTGNLNSFPCSGKDLVIAYNSGNATHHITITSVADPFGRTGDVASEAIIAGAHRVFGPFFASGWRESDGNIYLQADDASVQFAVIPLP